MIFFWSKKKVAKSSLILWNEIWIRAASNQLKWKTDTTNQPTCLLFKVFPLQWFSFLHTFPCLLWAVRNHRRGKITKREEMKNIVNKTKFDCIQNSGDKNSLSAYRKLVNKKYKSEKKQLALKYKHSSVKTQQWKL